MTRWQVLKQHYRQDPVGLMCIGAAFVVIAAITVLTVHDWWVTGNLASLLFAVGSVAVIVWCGHIVSTEG